jgi:hypothetical protein
VKRWKKVCYIGKGREIKKKQLKWKENENNPRSTALRKCFLRPLTFGTVLFRLQRLIKSLFSLKPKSVTVTLNCKSWVQKRIRLMLSV